MIIRLKVFIPVVLLLSLITLFILYRMDAWLKENLESSISLITKTKTDITSLKLSLVNSSLTIRKLEVASKSDEFKNSIEFEDIIFDFQTLPLLRKRVVVDNFSIKGVQWGTARKTSGKLPPEPIKKSEPSWISDLTDEAMDSLKKEMEEVPVGKLFEFRIPENPREIVESLQLKSLEAYKNTVIQGQNIRSGWDARLKDMRGMSEFETQINLVRNALQNVPSNPGEIVNRVKTVQTAMDFFQSEKKKAEAMVGDAKSDLQRIQTVVDGANEALQSDWQRLSEMVSLDQLNMNNFSRLLFGPEWINRAENILKYHKLLRQMMAKSSSKDDVQIRPRAKGRDIIFIAEKVQPSFVLAKSEFSVKGLEGGNRKNVNQYFELKVQDLNSSPKLYGKPTTVDFKAQFKEEKIAEAYLNMFWDYTKDIPKDSYKAGAERLNAADWPMGIPRLFPLKISKGFADTRSELEFTGEEMKWVNRIDFKAVDWDFSEVPNQGIIIPLLKDVFAKVKDFQLTLQLKRTGERLSLGIESDLDKLIQAGLSAAIEKRFHEFKDRMRKDLDARVSIAKKQAMAQLSAFQSEVENSVSDYVAKSTNYIQEANSAKESLERKAKEGVTSEVKKSLPKIKLPKF